MTEREYIIFSDESVQHGQYYSNFYGGLIVGAREYQAVSERLNQTKAGLNLYGELKWAKVTAQYLSKYQEVITRFFEEVRNQKIRVRILFRQNAYEITGLTREDRNLGYFKIYYQFIKHAFGLQYIPASQQPINLRLYFDKMPDTKEKISQFKGYLQGLPATKSYHSGEIRLLPENITEVRSHDHILLQCLDIVLGSFAFRLNDRHLDKPLGQRARGKRTIAKEKLYKSILAEIRSIHPNFNIGITTGVSNVEDRWSSP